MKRGKIRVKGVWREQPDIRLLVVALLELARQMQAADEAKPTELPEPGEGARG